MPIYEIETKGSEAKRLVKADSAAQAIRHCATGMFTARTLTKVEDAAGLFAAGVKMETVGQLPPEPEVEQEQEPDGGQQQEEPLKPAVEPEVQQPPAGKSKKGD